jgi:hypothetical protein
VSTTKVIQRVTAPALHVEISTVAASASTPDSSVGEDGLQAVLDTVVGVDTSSLDTKPARIMPEPVVATWEVHRLREILPGASRVPGYSEKFNNLDFGLNTKL